MAVLPEGLPDLISSIATATRQLVHAYGQLNRLHTFEFSGHDEVAAGDFSSELVLEIDAAVVTELRAAIEQEVDAGSFTLGEAAHLVSSLMDALEDMDPEVFVGPGEEIEDAV